MQSITKESFELGLTLIVLRILINYFICTIFTVLII